MTHILVAEDDKITRMIVKKLLENNGYQVSLTENGKDALDLLLKETPTIYNLLLTDYQMPEMDGIELIDKVRENKIKIPIVVFTNMDDKNLIIELMRKGCNDYVEKPISPKTLPLIIENALKRGLG